MNENPQSNMAWEDRLTWFKSSPEYRALDRIDGEPRIHHIAAQPQSSRVTVKIERNTRETYWTDHLHADVQRHLMGIKGQQERMREMLNSFLSVQRDSEQDNGHSSGLDQRKSGILSVKTVHKVNGTKLRRK